VPAPKNPQQFNRFAYGLNNPVKYTDPTGHDVDCAIGDSGCKKSTAKTPLKPPLLPLKNGDNWAQDCVWPSNLQSGVDRVYQMIKNARSVSGKLAADNLTYWFGGQGGTRLIPEQDLINDPTVLDYLRGETRNRFIKGAERRLQSGELQSGGSVGMHWEGNVQAPFLTDLYFGLGGFTVSSDVVVSAEANGSNVQITFNEWWTYVSDVYNWDPGKSTMIPGTGYVTDNEMRALEVPNGCAQSFNIMSPTWFVTDPTATSPFSISP
jgi:hypothetical protein